MEIAHHKGFMPAGQVDVRHVADISVFIGEQFPVQIVELNKDKNPYCSIVIAPKLKKLVEKGVITP